MSDGHKIVTSHWRKPIPTSAFDWAAHFDNDPNDEYPVTGYGASELAAIIELLEKVEDGS
jgi:hypothetical protein